MKTLLDTMKKSLERHDTPAICSNCFDFMQRYQYFCNNYEKIKKTDLYILCVSMLKSIYLNIDVNAYINLLLKEIKNLNQEF